jgi:hypothetical protein
MLAAAIATVTMVFRAFTPVLSSLSTAVLRSLSFRVVLALS